MLDPMTVNSEPGQERALSKDFDSASDEASEIDEAEAELTPRPRKKGDQDQLRYELDSSADDDEPFKTPLTLRKKRVAKKRVVMDSDDQEEKQEAVKRKRVEGISKKTETKGDNKKEAVKRDQGISKKKEKMGNSDKQVGVKLKPYRPRFDLSLLFRGG